MLFKRLSGSVLILNIETPKMTSNFDECNNSKLSFPPEGQETGCGATQFSPEAQDNLIKRDRFELLSAYLDGEVTAAERRQVEDWLATDATTQRLHARLLKLRQGLRGLPIPVSEHPVEQVVQQVSSRLERRPKRLVWGGLAIAALFVGALTSVLPRDHYAPSIAEAPKTTEHASPSDGLMIALDRPPITIPKAPVAPSQSIFSPEKNLQ
jgi:hypothetical protein